MSIETLNIVQKKLELNPVYSIVQLSSSKGCCYFGNEITCKKHTSSLVNNNLGTVVQQCICIDTEASASIYERRQIR